MGGTTTFDLVILGSGSTAFAAALRAQELGKTAVMIESRSIGGTCVGRGCLPSKNLIEAARLVHDAKNPRYPGLRPAALEIDFGALVRQKDEVIADYRQKRYESLVGGNLRVEKGHARFFDPNTIDVDGRRLTGQAMLIATGSRPAIPNIEGLSEVPSLTSDLLTSGEDVELRELPRSLLIVGGGYIALELGQMFRRFGSEVTILERGMELLAEGYEPEVGPTVREILEREGVTVLTRTTPKTVRRDGGGVVATCDVNGSPREIRAERLLIATGRRPNTDAIGIEKAGVRLGERGQVLVDEHLRTNVPHIFAAGDVIGREQGSQMATPVGSQDGGIVGHNAFSAEPARSVNHRVIPRAIFIDPPLAVVGMTEEEAVAAGHPCWCKATPMSVVPRAGAIRDTRGFVKMVADAKTNEVLGVTMVGAGAAEVIHEAAMALRFRAKVGDFIELLHVYPTMAEALKIAAISRYKDPAKLSCCAESASGETASSETGQEGAGTKGIWRQFAGLFGAGVAAACCLGISVVLSAVGAAGLSFLVRDAYLFPIFVGFVAFSLWMLYRSARKHGNLAPFYLGATGAFIGATGLWLMVTGIYPTRWGVYAGLLILVAGSVWDAMLGRKPVACACDVPRRDKSKGSRRVATGAALSVAAASAFYGLYKSVAAVAPAASGEDIACWGINDCKGKTACTTAFNACTGQNQCKGRGYLNVPPKACAAKGGVPLKDSPADPERSKG